ncbi:prohead protease/major capsid protein fusion protein [Amorphus orientalis]|uniref:Phage major head subunit gpT-like protein/phage head maturation protease n=1 Tax=Amorphus orientalis TaxID=649198 RepID=A0AAE3VSK0_9HYPH|nr:prohead protease/major capsid protein fusion protein [Amorphus orientalis]MDQ0317356.1 phage major head subunit gpT-like protein/phage head maturation protease [Amorphus orientalis]
MTIKETIAAPKFGRSAEIRAASYDEADNTIEVVWTTGAAVRRRNWRTGDIYNEILVVTPEAVRMDRLNAGAPLLDTHDDWSLRSVIGSVVPGSARIEGGQGLARVQLSSAPGDADTVHKIRTGVIRNISVGYVIHAVEKTEKEDGTEDWRVIDWEPMEISAVPVPADAGSQFRNRNTDDGSMVEITDLHAAVRAERERASTIRKLATEAHAAELGETHASEGTSVDAFRSILLEHLIAKEAEAPTSGNVRAEVGTEHAEKRAHVIESVLMHRVDPSANTLTDGAGEFRGMTLTELARDALEASGINTRGMSKYEVASETLAYRGGGMHTTSDFTVILGNTVNRTLRAAYEAAPQTFRPLVRETTVSDFKTVTRAQLGEAPQLERVNEHGEFKRGTIGEGKEAYKIATFGKIVGITRQALINDDLGAFSRLAQMFGVQAAQLESDLVWWQILSNPTMGDNVALFHLASHKNLQSAAAFSKGTLSKMRTAMAKQVGIDGKTVLNIRPAFLMIPVELEDTAAELLRSTRYPDATTNAVADSLKALSIISEPRIDNGISNESIGAAVAGSATAHYLAAAPAATDTVELAYLEGSRGVYTESKMGFNIDGVEIKVRMDAGAKVIDWRAFQKNAGA